MDNETVNQLRTRLWIATAIAFGFIACASYLSGLTLHADSVGKFCLYLTIATLAGCLDIGALARFSRIVYAIDALLLFTVISAIGAVASYVTMRNSGPLTDVFLDGLDRALGLNRGLIRRTVEQNTFLLDLLNAAYFACFVMPLIVIVLLSISPHIDRLYRYIWAHGTTLAITVATAWFFPAQAAFEYYAHDNLPGNAVHYGRIIAGLRDGSFLTINLNDLGGIITFPSFHATMAILFIWAIWPLRSARLPMSIVNGLMWFAAIPIGGHYVVDLIGGTAIAVIAIVLSDRRINIKSAEVALPSGMTTGGAIPSHRRGHNGPVQCVSIRNP